jgi:glutaredoxin
MKFRNSFFTLFTILICSSIQTVFADQLYKWVDQQGNVTYQSSPPPDGAMNVEKSALTSEPVADEDEAGETLPIKYYTKPDCPACDQARTYFEEVGVATAEVDISENTSEADKMKKQLGHNDVPTILVGNKSITGFQKKMMDRILTSAGYDIPGVENTDESASEASENSASNEEEVKDEVQEEVQER